MYVGSQFKQDFTERGDVIVTTMDAAAARRQHPRVALAVLCSLAGLGLAGCSGGSLFDSGTAAQPQETAPVAAARPAPQPPPLAKIAIAPIVGAPDPVAKQVLQEFTSSVEKQRVAVAAGRDERVDYTLRGYIVAAKDKNATKVSYIWDITDPTGKRVNRITGEEVVTSGPSKDPWAALSPAVAQTIASRAASSFVAWLPSQQGAGTPVASNPTAPVGVGAQAGDPARTTRPAGQPKALAAAPQRPEQTTGSIARDGAVTALVPSVTGAPGDGSSSLTVAIQRELSSKGVRVAERTAGSAYRVEGSVTLGAARDGKQPIQIEWLVRDPQGKKLGTVSQRNEIPEGSLDGPWGKTAEQAAGAAVQGIVKLLPQKAVN